VCVYCLLQGQEERGSVEDHSLDIMPFILHAEYEAGICSLKVPLSNSAEGYHRSRPLLHHPHKKT
jgi:hypothetical protein